jgi:hypothetical protein
LNIFDVLLLQKLDFNSTFHFFLFGLIHPKRSSAKPDYGADQHQGFGKFRSNATLQNQKGRDSVSAKAANDIIFNTLFIISRF